MTAVTLKGLLGRKFRATLTALAIILGVAMVSGTYVLTDTISKAFDEIFSGSYENTSAVVTGRQIVKFSSSGSATVPAQVLSRIRALPDVETASGQIFDLSGASNYAKLIGRDGETLGGSGGAPTFAFGLDGTEPSLSPVSLVEGNWANGPNEIVIDSSTAKSHDYGPGDEIRVSAQGPIERYRITGLSKFGSVDSLGGATFAVFDVPTAQKLLQKENVYDAIAVAARSGVSPERLAAEIRPLIPPTAQVKTGEEQAKSSSKDTKEFTKFIQLFLLSFGGIALFVGAFVIFNTLSITVAQRAREFATLRTLGASRRQVMRSVLLEGLVIGAIASVIGLFLGVALARGLSSVFAALSLDLPQSGTVFATRTVVVSLVVGILITAVATFAPAIRATRVPPILAVREGAELPKSRLAPFSTLLALVTLALAVALVGYGAFVGSAGTKPRLVALGLGVVALFIGVALVSARIVRPLASFVGTPARTLGGSPGRLARDNAVRNPGRTASTAAALMIGLALVTIVASLGKGMRSAGEDSLREQVRADYVITSENGFDPFPVAAGESVVGAPGVDVVSAVRSEHARVFRSDVTVDGIDPATIERVYRFSWKTGSDDVVRGLGVDQAVVSERFADKHKVGVDDIIRLTTPNGQHFLFGIKGVFSPPKIDKLDPVLGSVVISKLAFDQSFTRPKNIYSFVNGSNGASAATAASIEGRLAAYPDATVRTRDAWVAKRSAGINQLLNLLYVLLALSVIVSLFGMVNTLVLAVFERTRELGMLRAVGMTRRQTRRMIRHESVITALIGAALGLPLGLLMAALVTRALEDQGLAFRVPVLPLVIFAVIAVVAGVVAAILPARRAAQLNVLQALQYE